MWVHLKIWYTCVYYPGIIYILIFISFVYCLRKFKQVVDSCFGNNLDNDFEDRICAFKSAFLECKDVSQSFGQDLRLTWKVHIIFNHIVPFCKYHNSGLGMFAEQTGESIHAKFKSTYARYKRDSQHIDHGSKLKRSVINFGIRRIL